MGKKKPIKYIQVRYDANGMSSDYAVEVAHHAEFLVLLLAGLRDRLRVGSLPRVLELITETSNIMKKERGVDLVNLVVSMIDGGMRVSLFFAVPMKGSSR